MTKPEPESWKWSGSIITRVIDGDTIEAKVTMVADAGFRQSVTFQYPVKLRLARINTPSKRTINGRAALERVKELTITPVMVETFKTYKYGGGDVPEWMAEITLPNGSNLSDLLVNEGHAEYWDGSGVKPGG